MVNFLLHMLSLFLGVFAGTVTGLIPGVHINMVSGLLIANLNYFSVDYFLLSVFIISMSITHTFLDSVPSILLGVPDESTVFNILPGHRMVLDGKGLLAIKYTLFGSFFGLIVTVLLSFILVFIIKQVYSIVRFLIPYLLLIIVFVLLLKYKHNLLINSFLFVVSGLVGFFVLNLDFNNPLFHIFSGMFGLSNLLFSLSSNRIPVQTKHKFSVDSSHKKASFIAVIMGVFAGFLPGLGNSQSTAIGMGFIKNKNPENVLTFTGTLNTVNMITSLMTFYAINKARNGSIVALKKLITLNMNSFILLILSSVVAGSIAVFLSVFLSHYFIKLLNKLNYRYIVIFIILLIVVLSLVFDGLKGFFVLLLTMNIGFIATKLNAQKSFLMGVLILPIEFYFFIN